MRMKTQVTRTIIFRLPDLQQQHNHAMSPPTMPRQLQTFKGSLQLHRWSFNLDVFDASECIWMFCVVQARLAEKSASPETPAPKKRRKSTTSKQGRSPSAAGVNLLILTQSVPQGGIVGKLNLFIVPEIVACFGLRWRRTVCREVGLQAPTTYIAVRVSCRHSLGRLLGVIKAL